MPKNLVSQLLQLTMINANILVHAGLLHSSENKPQSTARKARRILRKLYLLDIVNFQKIYLPKSDRVHKFYYLKKTQIPFHSIKIPEHDANTALYLAHLFHSAQQNYQMSWHPPFPIGNKVCDGAVLLKKNDELSFAVIIESDTGSHTQGEIREKCQAYIEIVDDNPNIFIVFLTTSQNRKENMESIIKQEIEEDYQKNVSVLCPHLLSANQTVFPIRRTK